jgi:hypothetical protein
MLNKKTILSILILLAVSVIISFRVLAYSSDNVTGWLWGGSDDGAGNSDGIGWISANNTSGGGANSYGLNIPTMDGSVSGYAWSENVGWISVNPSDLTGCPDGNCAAQRMGNVITGWGRIISIPQAGSNAGGWQGWIKLSGNAQDGSSYGVAIDPANNKLSGYAWSDELGWIDFSKASLNVTYSLKICYDCTSASNRLGSLSLTRGLNYSAKACKVVSTETTCNGIDLTSVAGISWNSDNNTNVCVDNSGKITGNETGSAIVTVSDSVSGLSDTLNVSVIPIPAYCGDGSCNNGETCSACQQDCGKCQDLNWREVSPN